MLHRPSATVSVTSEYERISSTPVSDLRSPVILDMTGTGKTITALLGSILFASERKVDIEKIHPEIVPAVTGVTDVTGVPGRDPSSPLVSGKCIVFTPRHLIQH